METNLNHVPKIENNDDNDDDYEVSNRLVDEYLVQTNSNYEEFLTQNSFTSTCPVDEFSSQQKDANNNFPNADSLPDQEFKPVSSLSHSNSSLLINFIDRSTLKRTIDANAALFAQLVNHNDRAHICESYLNLTNRVHTSSTRSTLLKYSKSIFLVSLFLLASIYIGLWIEFFVLIFATLGIFKIVFLLVERLIIRDWLTYASRYSECTRDVLTLLRESELVSLSVERRHLIETKSSSSSSIVDFDDRLNLEFRRTVFFKLRDEFHRLRRLNLELNRFARLDDLLSSVSDSELADVLRIDSQQPLQFDELEIKTDCFSLACLKSLARVVRLVLSENFKLVVAVYVEMAFSDQSSCSFLAKSLVNGFVPVFMGFKKSIAQLNEIKDIIDLKNLINENRQNPSKKTTKKSETSSLIDPTGERNLGLYLRNSLLQFHQLTQSYSDPLESLKLIKSSLSYCDFYVKQLISGIEKSTNNESQYSDEVQANLLNESTNSRSQKPAQAVPFSPLPPIEDEIFEEDMSKVKETERMSGADASSSGDLDPSSELRIDPLANKNLFYELKFALKFKSNEWQQREKIAKKKAMNQSEEDRVEKAVVCDDVDGGGSVTNVEHLLENEALKYKSELRRRRKRHGGGPGPVEAERKRKYVYEADHDDDGGGSSHHQSSPPVFLTELFNKTTVLFQQQQQFGNHQDEETLVYE